jgi:type I restriction enzyme S subunit
MKLAEGWVNRRFNEFGTVLSGSTPSTSTLSFWDGEIVWVTPSDLSRLKTAYLSDSSKRITQKGLDSCSANLTPAGSIVVSSRAPIGYVAIASVPLCTNQGCKTITPKSGFRSDFVYYNVLFHIDKVKNLGEGTTFAEISKTALETVVLPFPSSPLEQAKIAEILSKLDHAIEQTEASISKQRRIEIGLMHDLLTRGIDEHGDLRSESTHEFKDSPLGRIPVEWKVSRTGDVCQSLVPGRDKPDLDGGGIPWITIPDVDELYCRSSKAGYSLSMRAIKASNARVMPPGTVLMSCVGEFGIATVATENIVANQQLHGFIPDATLLPEWLAIQIIYSGARLDRMATQTTIKYLNKTGCESLLIAMPERSEQERGFAILKSVIDRLSVQNRQLQKLRSVKAALMEDLLTGKRRVTTLLHEEIEPRKKAS